MYNKIRKTLIILFYPLIILSMIAFNILGSVMLIFMCKTSKEWKEFMVDSIKDSIDFLKLK